MFTKHKDCVLKTVTELYVCAHRAAEVISSHNKGAYLGRVREMLGMYGMVKNGVNMKQKQGVSREAGERSN